MLFSRENTLKQQNCGQTSSFPLLEKQHDLTHLVYPHCNLMTQIQRVGPCYFPSLPFISTTTLLTSLRNPLNSISRYGIF